MSKTYPVGASGRQAGARGRGARTGVKPIPAAGAGQGISGMGMEADQSEECSQGGQPIERVQRRDAYTVITPDEKKRQSIAAQARRETEKYERYRATKKTKFVSYSGTVGGEGVTESKARQQLQQTAKSQKVNSMQKQASYRQANKDRENAELEQKKAEQRRKSVENATRGKDRQDMLKQDQEKKNNAFLKRLEKESKAKCCSNRNRVIPPEELPTSPPGASASSDSLKALQQRFPMYDSEALLEILQQTNEDLSLAFELLSVT
ncbi:hypothetical protein CAPTEDRAFT_192156 [Capitella teleta]|uniref:CUE domain-containing protein n=1 Tax=Capitella teleta TaxID=283909 RepID=R7VFI3_CAPTE|nr:hypothetical protein CAPTEDRAFT_192156 [Capitella teleta]|eukprot:ELU15061.1 hypothetical protein CAPTEDRAFT_192156 [Capitella teleta]